MAQVKEDLRQNLINKIISDNYGNNDDAKTRKFLESLTIEELEDIINSQI